MTNYNALAISTYLWRWVFLCGGFLAMGVGLLRFLFLPARKMVQAKPKWTKITSPSCLRVFLVTSPMATAIYTALIFLPGYFHIQGVMSTAQSSIYASISTLALMVMIILVPLLFRNMTSRSLFILGNRMLLICALPICWLMSVHDFYVAGIVLIIPVAIILSAGLTLICELCPKGGAQCLIISFAYNIAMSLCGGFTPLLATALSFHVSVFWGPMIIPTVTSIIFLLLRRATLLFWQ